MITQEFLKHEFHYDLESGVFVRIGSSNSKSQRGTRVGSVHSAGYLTVRISNKQHFLHRLAWIYCYGDIPQGMKIDHVNRIRNDNRLINLRLVTCQQNQQNKVISKFNKSGYSGVYYCNTYKKWKAQIGVGKRRTKALGSFTSKSEAISARLAAEKTLNYVNMI